MQIISGVETARRSFFVAQIPGRDQAKLAAWNFATHIERDPQPKPKPNNPTP